MKKILTATQMIFKKSFALSIALILFSTIGFSQFSTTYLNTLDTATFGDTLPTSIVVRNVGTTTYTGNIGIYYVTNTLPLSPLTLCTITNVTLSPNDTVSTNCTLYTNSAHFTNGDNIVVVWSSGNGKLQVDSISEYVYLNPQIAGVHENDLSAAFSIYPSLTKDFINVETSGNIFPLKIFITDVTGRIIKIISPSPESKGKIKINTSELNEGVYFIDMLMPDRRRMVSKFVKTE